MITTNEKREIVAALISAIDHEGIQKLQAAKALNLHPNYITWALNEKYWDGIGGRWERLKDWFVSREKLMDFKIPEGEEITEFFKFKEAPVEKAPAEKTEEKAGPAEVPIEKAAEIQVARKESKQGSRRPKQDKTVKLVLNQAEMRKLQGKVELLESIAEKFASRFLEIEEQIKERNRFFLQKIEEVETLKNQLSIANKCYETLLKRVDLIDEAAGSMIAAKSEKEPRHSIVIFQRNSYSKS